MESTKQTPIEDQRKDALAHYEELSSKACHFSSFVKDAILAYNPVTEDKKAPEKDDPISACINFLESLKFKPSYTIDQLKQIKEYLGRSEAKHEKIKSLESKLSTLEETLKAADEVIEFTLDPNRIGTPARLALEKYNELKQKV